MSFRPDASDYKALDSFLEGALDTHKSGTDQRKVVGILTHALTLASEDKQVEFKKFIRLTNEDLFEFDE